MTKTELEGSYLYGAVKYRVSGEPVAMYHCHCQRCRKMNGTGHASNIRVKSASVKWLQGEALINSYKVPEADRFRNDFCGQCGSPLPRYFAALELVVLPAGTLDVEPQKLPTSRIFNNSRASWSCEDDLPSFEEYPPNL